MRGVGQFLAVAVVALALTACDDARPTRTTSGQTQGTARPDGDCAATARTTSRTATVFYALRFTAAPGARARGRQDATRYTYPPVSPGFLLADGSPPRQPLTDALTEAVPTASSVVDGTRLLRWDVRNRTTTQGRYLAYAGATVLRGRWRAADCADQAPGGRVHGTFVLVGPVRAGVVRCAGDVQGEGLRRAAEVVACHADSDEARPFRTP